MRIDKIDGWRFWAVFSVIFSHLASHSPYYTTINSVIRVDGFGLLGVEVFFFISGFVICASLINELKLFGCFSSKDFYIRRCFRILPPLWIYLLVITIASSFGVIEFDKEGIWISALFLSNLHGFFPVHWYVGHTWSLSYEEQFYIIFPIILLLSYRANKTVIFPVFLVFSPILSLSCYYFHMELPAGFFRFFDFIVSV